MQFSVMSFKKNTRTLLILNPNSYFNYPNVSITEIKKNLNYVIKCNHDHGCSCFLLV